MKMKYKWFNGIVIASLLVPTLGLTVNQQVTTSEKRDLAQFPSLFADGSFNWNFLEEMGDWYDDHFAFRSQMISEIGRASCRDRV